VRVGILGWDYEEFESVNLYETAQKIGYETDLFTLSDITYSSDGLKVKGGNIESFDVIISRAQIRPDRYAEDLEIYTSLEVAGVPVIDGASNFYASESKLLTMQRLKKEGLPVVDTHQCRSIEEVEQYFERYGEIVVKPSYGFAGIGVEKVSNNFSTQKVDIEKLLKKYESVLVQPFVPHPDGDVRVTVVGDDVLFSIRRIPNEKTWKANVSLGADIEINTPSEQEKEIGVKAAKVMGISISGVDLLQHGDEYYVLEVNSVPGWYKGFSKEQCFEFCRQMIEYCINKAEPVSVSQ